MTTSNSDFELCNNVWKEITSKYSKTSSATDFSEFERIVVLVWTVTGIIENGGFQYLFESELPGDNDLSLTIAAFGCIGCDAAKAVIEEVLSSLEFAGSSKDTYFKRYMKLSLEDRKGFDSRFWSEIDIINTFLAIYIRSNKA